MNRVTATLQCSLISSPYYFELSTPMEVVDMPFSEFDGQISNYKMNRKSKLMSNDVRVSSVPNFFSTKFGRSIQSR